MRRKDRYLIECNDFSRIGRLPFIGWAHRREWIIAFCRSPIDTSKGFVSFIRGAFYGTK